MKVAKHEPFRTATEYTSRQNGLPAHSCLTMFSVLVLSFVSSLVQASTSPERPDFKPLRYEEDWTFLKDSERRDDYFDFIKYISLSRDHDQYLTIGGEMRPYYELFENERWGADPEDDNGHFLQRYMLHADLHLHPNFRFFSQVKSCLENGRTGGPRPTDEDTLDLHQAFADFTWHPNEKGAFLFRLGRQEIGFGSSRLISTREVANVRRSFDGLRVTWHEGVWNIDGFATRPVQTNREIFDDHTDHTQAFWGVYAVRPWSLLNLNGNIDLYYLGLDKKQARFNQGSGREQRQMIGTRIWNSRGPFDFNFELVYQFGTFADHGNISAWMIDSDTGYTFHKLRLHPRIGLKADVASGDEDPNDPDLQTFNPLFPRGDYFGWLSPIGPLNHLGLHPKFSLMFSKTVSLTAEWVFYWRENANDGIYSISGALLRSGNSGTGRFIGHQPAVMAKWQLDRHTTYTIYWAHFIIGEFFDRSPSAKSITYFGSWLTYKF